MEKWNVVDNLFVTFLLLLLFLFIFQLEMRVKKSIFEKVKF